MSGISMGVPSLLPHNLNAARVEFRQQIASVASCVQKPTLGEFDSTAWWGYRVGEIPSTIV